MRRSRRPLRTRIVATTAVVSAVAMAAMIAAVVLTLNNITLKSVDSDLKDRVSVLTSAIKREANNPSRAIETASDSIDDTTWLYDSAGVQLDGPDASNRVQAIADRLGKATTRTRLLSHERVYLATPVLVGGSHPGKVVLVVSKSLEPYQSTRTGIIIGLVALGLVVTAGGAAIAAWTVGRTLTPVEAMAALADEWSERALDRRFDDLGTADEIGHLARTLNVLLDRVAGALRSEQLLTSELAHELRTPLTGIRGEAELALMKAPSPATKEHLCRVVDLTDEMSTTIGTLLAIARGGDHAGTRTTIRDVVAATMDGHPDAALEVDIDLGEAAGQVYLSATTDLAVRALSPLVDNALRHATSCVTLTAQVAARSVDINVSDDGPGLKGDADSVFHAGTRDAASQGAGLGLPLARRVAQSLGGRVRLTSRSTPTTFTLTLPRV